MIDESMIEEFKIEAQEMFENSEEGFLKIERGENFTDNYNQIFRAFHSLKGAAGMFGLDDLQSHMHKLESLFEAQKNNNTLDKAQIDYFLSGIDGAKQLLEGQSINFTYYTIDEFKNISDGASKVLPDNKEAVKKAVEVKKKTKGLFYIVDDEQSILEILSDILSDLDFGVTTFNNANDLINSITEDAPDVILSDIKMPEMNGVEMLHRLRDEGIDTPIIFISGYISKEIMLDALSHGAYGFIEKPFNEVHLKSICTNAMKKAQIQKLLQKSINYILYQFSDLDNYLKEQGKDTLRTSLKNELSMILEQQKNLKSLK